MVAAKLDSTPLNPTKQTKHSAYPVIDCCHDNPLVSRMNNPSVTQQAFALLSPDEVLNTVESFGFRCDGRLMALNSYENRVYRVGIEDHSSNALVAKFYRPQRWSNVQIEEEHQFTQELADLEIPVVAPIAINGTTSL